MRVWFSADRGHGLAYRMSYIMCIWLCDVDVFVTKCLTDRAGFWTTVTSNGSPYAAGALSCLSVTLVYCGQTVGWIRIPLGTEVGLGPDDIVLDGDPSALRKEAQQPPRFGPCLLWPNGRPSQQLVSCC